MASKGPKTRMKRRSLAPARPKLAALKKKRRRLAETKLDAIKLRMRLPARPA